MKNLYCTYSVVGLPHKANLPYLAAAMKGAS